MRRQIDTMMLEMALVGFKAKREELIRNMADIQQRLAGTRKAAPEETTAAPVTKPKRKLSAAGKKAIQAAVKKRWASYHAKTGAEKPARGAAKKAKRVISPEARARLAANLAKARAAKASKQKSTSGKN